MWRCREGGFVYKSELQGKVWAGHIHVRVNKCMFLKATAYPQSDQREGESSVREGGQGKGLEGAEGQEIWGARTWGGGLRAWANAAAGHRDGPRDDGGLGNTEATGTPQGAASVQLWAWELSVCSEENRRERGQKNTAGSFKGLCSEGKERIGGS